MKRGIISMDPTQSNFVRFENMSTGLWLIDFVSNDSSFVWLDGCYEMSYRGDAVGILLEMKMTPLKILMVQRRTQSV